MTNKVDSLKHHEKITILSIYYKMIIQFYNITFYSKLYNIQLRNKAR